MGKFKEECGVFGAIGVDRASYIAYQGIYALQHRGQESAGIATFSEGKMHYHKYMGLVSEIFKKYDFNKLPGTIAIAHNRYSTSGSSSLVNAQPICMECKQGMIGMAHNGNLINANILRTKLQKQGAIFQTTSDSEVIVHLISRAKSSKLIPALKSALLKIKGAYSIVVMTPDSLIAARDPNGFRPLALGKLDKGFCVASETCAFDLIGAQYIREIKPGEILKINKDMSMRSIYLPKAKRLAKCIFEYIYFSRPDSVIFGENCDKIRREMGRQLAREDDYKDADIVISVPDSSNTAALGYAEESKIRFEIGLIRNHYVGRTFIKPSQDDRELSVRVKFNPVKGVISNKKIILVEDSIVRGTTLRGLIKFLKSYGASEIHVRVASPMVIRPCFFGIDLSTKKEIIGANKTLDEICKFIGADSLRYISIKGLIGATGGNKKDFCAGCFDGSYPMKTPRNFEKVMMEKK
ncbi:MAG: hypothetical protein ACD_79C00682G0007 [uncultured bacterium]|nr:MAG: hypothetical protein ACD_79C00682G0007 [uncultured bacterium]